MRAFLLLLDGYACHRRIIAQITLIGYILGMKNFDDMGIKVPEILLPKNLDTEKWAVIACDQYTQDKNYWIQTAKLTSGSPSALNIILPEIYLNDNTGERIKKIRENMNSYIKNGIFDNVRKEFIYIERKTAFGRLRHGLIAEIDLDRYDWKPGTREFIRATEATIKERIPPRMKIRSGAPLESPHIMLLANDPERIFVDGIGERVRCNTPLYSGKLMQNGGSISGWNVSSEDDIEYLRASLETLFTENTQKDGSTFLFAVGDGNHSLATAKAVWEERKAEIKSSGADMSALKTDPVRYALVEIVNLYDTGLTFEPIHRVMFGANPKEFIEFISQRLGGTISALKTADELEKCVKNSKADFGFIYTEDGKTVYKLVSTNMTDLAVTGFQPSADDFINSHSGIAIDYIHGAKETVTLGKQNGTLGILLPPIAKDSFFTTIAGHGALPRKSFSMGEADEKRFYMECRRLFN